MAGDDSSDCEDFGHEWEEYIGMYGNAEVYIGVECIYCGVGREDV